MSFAAVASPLNAAGISHSLSVGLTVTPTPEPTVTVTVTETAPPSGPATVVLDGDQFAAFIIGIALVVTFVAAALVRSFRGSH